MLLTSHSGFADIARRAALQAGFDLCGIVPYPFAEVEHFERWIENGSHGDMSYLTARNDAGELKRVNPEAALPWARSLIVCALNYNPDVPYSTEVQDRTKGWISRYAIGGKDGKSTDYHEALMSRLRKVEAELHSAFGEMQSRCYVDTGPIVERALAQIAGIGWIGKNTCLINERERLGSWIFLGVVATSYDIREQAAQTFSFSLPAPDRCGTCTRCIDACPTDALVAPYQMDARRCIAYLTIEKRGSIDPELRPLIGNNVFGCDICQDVCPWNRREQQRAPASRHAEFQALPELAAPDLEYLASLSVEEWRELFRGSPVKRAKYQGFLRNVCIAIGNSGDVNYLPRLRELAASEDEVIADHARWAIAEIER